MDSRRLMSSKCEKRANYAVQFLELRLEQEYTTILSLIYPEPLVPEQKRSVHIYNMPTGLYFKI